MRLDKNISTHRADPDPSIPLRPQLRGLKTLFDTQGDIFYTECSKSSRTTFLVSEKIIHLFIFQGGKYGIPLKMVHLHSFDDLPPCEQL